LLNNSPSVIPLKLSNFMISPHYGFGSIKCAFATLIVPNKCKKNNYAALASGA